MSEINSLMQRFDQAKTMMKSMARSGGRGMGAGVPGMGGMPGMGAMPGMGKKSRGRQKPQPKRRKSRSGNPAKRAQEEQAAQRPQQQGAAFGAEPPAEFDPSALPKLDKFLKP